jgi:hypothetical protein
MDVRAEVGHLSGQRVKSAGRAGAVFSDIARRLQLREQTVKLALGRLTLTRQERERSANKPTFPRDGETPARPRAASLGIFFPQDQTDVCCSYGPASRITSVTILSNGCAASSAARASAARRRGARVVREKGRLG